MENKKVTVILISGFKGAGKDYVAEILRHELEGSVVMSYAEPLKDIMSIALGMKRDDMDRFKNNNAELCVVDDKTSEYFYHNNMRQVLQKFGTEAMKKHFGADVWSKLFISKMPESGIVICPDWRFEREYNDLVDAVGKENVITLRVDNNDITPDNHPSETELIPFSFNYRVNNTQKSDVIKDHLSTFLKTWLPQHSKT